MDNIKIKSKGSLSLLILKTHIKRIGSSNSRGL